MLTGAPRGVALPDPQPELLADLLAARVNWVTGGATAEPADTTVLVVLRELDPAGLVAGAARFAGGLGTAEADRWRRSWTRAVFLFGDPVNLRPGDVRRSAGGAAWLGPFTGAHRPGPVRLLRPVTGRLPKLADGTNGRPLWIATAGLSLVDYLVHLHHTVAEAVLLDRLDPDEPLRLLHRPDLDPAGLGAAAYARVLPGPGGALRPYTWLSETS
ncbi:hypothetical protein GCM10009827_049510 [Dactylosporangium maewongense]|uniref:Uncharacterized protein n=1 Tax=Dactylosporangium maewongense TaxID=634393 RepID=A0ABP4LNY8_9ACTN